MLSNHDVVRHATRYGRAPGRENDPAGSVPCDRELGIRRARAAALLQLALPGAAYLYQGDELGLPEVEDLPEAVLCDPVWERSGRTNRGRDGCRVPVPWSGDEPPYGFGTSGSWLPQPPSWRSYTVWEQSCDPRWQHWSSTGRLSASAGTGSVSPTRQYSGWTCPKACCSSRAAGTSPAWSTCPSVPFRCLLPECRCWPVGGVMIVCFQLITPRGCTCVDSHD